MNSQGAHLLSCAIEPKRGPLRTSPNNAAIDAYLSSSLPFYLDRVNVVTLGAADEKGDLSSLMRSPGWGRHFWATSCSDSREHLVEKWSARRWIARIMICCIVAILMGFV